MLHTILWKSMGEETNAAPYYWVNRASLSLWYTSLGARVDLYNPSSYSGVKLLLMRKTSLFWETGKMKNCNFYITNIFHLYNIIYIRCENLILSRWMVESHSLKQLITLLLFTFSFPSRWLDPKALLHLSPDLGLEGNVLVALILVEPYSILHPWGLGTKRNTELSSETSILAPHLTHSTTTQSTPWHTHPKTQTRFPYYPFLSLLSHLHQTQRTNG